MKTDGAFQSVKKTDDSSTKQSEMFYTVQDLAVHRDACGNTGDYFLFTCKYSLVYVPVIFARCDDSPAFSYWSGFRSKEETPQG